MTRALVALVLLVASMAPARAQLAARASVETQECAAGFTPTDTACALTPPANAVAAPRGGWTCNPGFHDYDGQCRKVVIPANAHLSTYGHSWTCDDGFREQGNACVSRNSPEIVTIGSLCGPWDEFSGDRCVIGHLPVHARRLWRGGPWICRPGFQETDGKCAPTQIPRHARLDASGDGWICRRGYQPVMNRCVEIEVPNNASLGFFGDVWVCNRGFYELRGVCLPDTAEHKALVRQQAALVGRPVFQSSEPVPPRGRVRRQENPTTTFSLVGLVGVILGSLVIFFHLRDAPPPRAAPTFKMSHVPRARGTGTVALKWLSFGNRVDALTGAPILPSARTAQCRNCRAWYHAESMMTLRQENGARCVACGRAALGLSAA
ncbi:MAG: hypothetical protein K1X51_01810 [Rhodospirillaceae bacterium]|nr:hypothetical protein [Rhodospirillaceae bacterium]